MPDGTNGIALHRTAPIAADQRSTAFLLSHSEQMTYYGLAVMAAAALLMSFVPLTSAADLSFAVVEDAAAGTLLAELSTVPSLLARFNRTLLPQMRFGMLKESDTLAVDERTGKLYIKRQLDRETLCAYERRNDPCVISADVTLRSAQVVRILKIQVIVEDKNDNDPAFEKNDTTVFVSEAAAVGTIVAALPAAIDPDTDAYGVGSYTLKYGLGMFTLSEKIDAVGQTELTLVLRQAIDRETRDSYTLHVEAKDRGNPPRSSLMIVNIVVVDENDNAPVFGNYLYSAAIPESMQKGVVVASLKATDTDAGNNGQVRYALSPRSSERIKATFEVGEYTGDLKLKGALDRESTDSYIVPVLARDGGQIPMTSVALVNVTVLDMNDNAPKLKITTLQDYGSTETAVFENAQADTPIALLNVVDEDAGDNGQVACYLSTPLFALRKYHADEYEIFVNSALDRETNARVSVAVHCTDAGSPPLVSRALLTVNIMDVNDNAPTFDRYIYYSAPVQENNALGMQIVRVAAADRDSGLNSDLIYSLGPERDASAFAIDSAAGIVTAAAVLDRETQKDYVFTVKASDRGTPSLTGSATVIVRVEDVNDNAPVFTQAVYTFGVEENQPKFTAIGKVQADDTDYGSNGDIWYRLEDAGLGPFVIAHDSGVISTRVPLDRELSAVYQVSVVATDYGNPALSSTAKVTVMVRDENDSEPFVVYPSSGNDTVNASSEWTLNSTVLTVRAADMDAGDNGELGYFIHSGNEEGMFFICRTSGELKLAKDPRTSKEHSYLISVGVYDFGLPPHTAFATVRINMHPAGQRGDGGQGANSHLQASADGYISVDLAAVVTLCSLSGVVSLVLMIAIIRVRRQSVRERRVGCLQATLSALRLRPGETKPRRSRYDVGSVKVALNYFTESPYGDYAAEDQKFLTTFATDRIQRVEKTGAVRSHRSGCAAERATSTERAAGETAKNNNCDALTKQASVKSGSAHAGVHVALIELGVRSARGDTRQALSSPKFDGGNEHHRSGAASRQMSSSVIQAQRSANR